MSRLRWWAGTAVMAAAAGTTWALSHGAVVWPAVATVMMTGGWAFSYGTDRRAPWRKKASR